MFYLVLVIVCSIDPGFVGDHDSGSTCVKFYDRPEIHYYTLEKCATRAREIVDAIRADTARLEVTLPGPWSYRGKCYVPVIDENQLA
jgi:hypothetical protein